MDKIIKNLHNLVNQRFYLAENIESKLKKEMRELIEISTKLVSGDKLVIPIVKYAHTWREKKLGKYH